MFQQFVVPIALLLLAQPAWTQPLPDAVPQGLPDQPATLAPNVRMPEQIKDAEYQVKQATCKALSYGVLQEALLAQVQQTLIEQKANQTLSDVTTQYVAALTKIGTTTLCQP